MPLSLMLPATAPGCFPAVPLLVTLSTLLTITSPVASRVTDLHCSDVAAAGLLRYCWLVRFTAFAFRA